MTDVLRRSGYPAAFLARQIVLRTLADNIQDDTKVLLNKRTSKIDHSADGVVVHCTDGSKYEGDVVVGADGVWSKVRQEMWRAAEKAELGAIPAEDKTGMFAASIADD